MEVLKVLVPFLNKVGPWVMGWLAGFRSPQAFALRRYQRRLERSYGEFRLMSNPASPPLRMQERYLPLQVEEPGRSQRLCIRDAIRDHRRLIVTGEPGAGKSMLLSHLALEFATNPRAARRENIPVIMELRHMVDDTAKQFEDHLVEQLKQAGFFRPDEFVESALDKGRLRVLLDGLDEVAQAQRALVCRRIDRFLTKYTGCDVVVTCRTAVREEVLWRQMHAVAVAELDNDLIQRFVATWLGDKHPHTSLLLHELLNNPRLLALARIPLLLTMMVSRYADERNPPARLPDSRAQFYKEAVSFLLKPQHGEQGTDMDRILDKRRVLSRLALTSLASGRDDGPIVHHEAAVSLAAALLKRKDKAARGLLREIVERSGLLRWSDEGYCFAHQAFQEYLAAEELGGDAWRLLELFLADRDRWHETVVLWCGIAKDPATMVRGLLQAGSPAALECLSEVGWLDEQIVGRIIRSFEEQLDHAGADSQAVRAFGIAASGPSLASKEVFDFLIREVESGSGPRQAAAAHALAVSHLEQAAVRLSRLYGSVPEVRAPVERMRDLAVKPLVSAARGGDGKAFGGLRAIGTPAAIDELLGLLWNPDDQIATCAAWALATMLANPSVEDALASYKLAGNQQMIPRYRWVWEPFSSDQTTRVIVSRIASFLKDGPEPAGVADDPPIDARLAIALGFVGSGSLSTDDDVLDDQESGAKLMYVLDWMEQVTKRNDLVRNMRRSRCLIDDVFDTKPHPEWPARQRELLLTYLKALKWGKRELRLLDCAPTEYLVELFQKHRDQAPSKDDWRLMFRKGPGLRPAAIGCGMFALAELVWLIVLVVVQTSRSFFPPGGFTVPPPTWLWWSALVIPTVIAAWIAWWQGAGLASTPRQLLKRILVVAIPPVVVLVILLFFVMPSVWLHAATGTWWMLLPVWALLPAATAAGLYLEDVQSKRDRSGLKGGLSALGGDQRVV